MIALDFTRVAAVARRWTRSLHALASVATAIICTMFCSHALAETDKPKVVLFLVDDMRSIR